MFTPPAGGVSIPTNTGHKERLTAKEAQAHPYFDPVRDEAVFKQNLAANAAAAASAASNN